MRFFLLLLIAALAMPSSFAMADETQKRPNILWVMAEDISLELGVYGHPAVKTPNLDKFAKEGALYTHAFGSSPSCSPNRSAMMAGVYQTRIDAQDHRRRTKFPLPKGVQPFPKLLKQAGYYTTIGNGYSSKNDMNFNGPKNLFDGKDWKKRPMGQPFFAQITLAITHRHAPDVWNKVRKESKHPVNPANVVLPPYYPDTPETRMDWALYLDSIEKMDSQFGQIMTRLEKEGIADNTVVIFIGDNGRCHLRGKNWLYDGGLRVPMMIRWPGKIKPDTVNNDMVALVDVTATILDIAGVDTSNSVLDGHPLLGDNAGKREYIFGARDMMGKVIDHSRAVRSKHFKYIRNYMPEVGYDQESKYTQAHRPMLPVMKKLKAEGKLNKIQLLVLQETKPKEELYDVIEDPHEINNLALLPEYKSQLAELSREMDKWIADTKDTGLQRMDEGK